jgi:hypothetical protein
MSVSEVLLSSESSENPPLAEPSLDSDSLSHSRALSFRS